MSNARDTYKALVKQATATETNAMALVNSDTKEGQEQFAKLWDKANALWAQANEIDLENSLTEQDLAEEKAKKEAERQAEITAYWARHEAQQQLKQELTAKIPQLKATVMSLGKLLKACLDSRAWPELDYKRRMAMSDLEDAQNQLRWIP